MKYKVNVLTELSVWADSEKEAKERAKTWDLSEHLSARGMRSIIVGVQLDNRKVTS